MLNRLTSRTLCSQLDVLQDDIKNLENLLKVAVYDNMEEMIGVFDFTALEYAQFNALLAFVATSLYFAYVKTQGIDPQKQAIQQQLDKVKLYMKRVNKLVCETSASKRATRVNPDAAKRLVQFYTTKCALPEDEFLNKKKSMGLLNSHDNDISKFSFKHVEPVRFLQTQETVVSAAIANKSTSSSSTSINNNDWRGENDKLRKHQISFIDNWTNPNRKRRQKTDKPKNQTP